MKGHLGFVIKPRPFQPIAFTLTSGSSYSVPFGAKTLKAWAVGAGEVTGAGGVAYKTWSVVAGQSITYTVSSTPGSDTTVTVDGTTITGYGGDTTGGGYAGGDGGATGGTGGSLDGGDGEYAGSVNGVGIDYQDWYDTMGGVPHPGNDVSGLWAAVELSGASFSASSDIGQGVASFPAYGGGYVAYVATPGGGGFGNGMGGYDPVYGPGGGAVVLLVT
jgi:hypothetical protein